MKKILIIDANNDFRVIFCKIIDQFKNNIKVFESSSNMGGLEVFKQEHPDIVFLDINLNDIEGDKMQHKIKVCYPDCKIIMLTPFKSAGFDRWYKTDEIEEFIDRDNLAENLMPLISKYL